jgi:hypothetical protein
MSKNRRLFYKPAYTNVKNFLKLVDNISKIIFGSLVNSLIKQSLMYSVETSAPSERGFVSTVHVLKGGEMIYSLQDFLKIETRFSWVDKKFLINKILELQKKTDDRRRSFLVFYEEGNQIREYINMDHSFTPLPYC